MHLYEIIDVKHVIVILKQHSKNIEPKKGKVILCCALKKNEMTMVKAVKISNFIVNIAIVNFHMLSPG